MDQPMKPPENLDLGAADDDLRQRISSGRTAILAEVFYFRHNFGKAVTEWKSDGTRVTNVDHAISKNIFDALVELFPEDDFCSEENQDDHETRPLSAEFAWVLDPVDGTNNYAVGVPECGISLGLLRNGIPVFGFIYDHGRDDLLQGGPGFGAFEGNELIRSANDALVNEKLTFCMHFPIPTDALDRLRDKLSVWRIRCPGSAAVGLANVAAGRLDGSLEFRSKPWDCAGGHPICVGAGASFHFLEEPCFPMGSFSTAMPSFPFYVGTPQFCDAVAEAFA
jgi:myo-inositol-1(or 4)-monophosphatase